MTIRGLLTQELATLTEEQLQQVASFIASLKTHAYANEMTARQDLREQIREGAIRRAERDLELTETWFELEEETWLRHSS